MLRNLLGICATTLFSLSLTCMAQADENASNPLAAVNNVDLRWQRITKGSATRNDYFIDGSHMVNPNMKLKYELHYVENDITGTSQAILKSWLLSHFGFSEPVK